MRHRPRPASRLTLVLCFGALVVAGGCFGRFEITRNLYGFNRTVAEDRFVRWAVFLAMNVAPMYPVGMALDALVANPIEFWSGKNPVRGSPRWFPRQASPTPVLGACHERVAGSSRGALHLVRAADALLAFDACGELVAEVTDVDGRATLVGGSLASR